MSNPYPHLYRVDGRPLPGLTPRVQRETTAACREITKRTGFGCWYHAGSVSVQYHRGNKPRFGVSEDTLHTGGRYHPISVLDACKRIWRSKVSMDKKMAQMQKAERANVTAREHALSKHAEDIGGSLVDELLHINRKQENPHSRRVFSF